MDDLSKLPERETPLTKEAVDVMSKYFEVGEKQGFNWKLLGIVVILFFVFSLSFSDQLIAKIPYMQNVYVALLFKTLLFMISVGAALYFLK